MKIYRCCGEDEFNSYKKGKKYVKPFGCGTNTFDYDKNKNYIHFFLFVESAYLYKKLKHNLFTKYFIECDIPIEILKKYYGFGWYEGVIPSYYAPIIEFAIPVNEFDINYICDISSTIKEKWLRPQKWEQYLSNIPKNFLANYEFGSFNFGYNEKSILGISLEKLVGKDFELSKETSSRSLDKKT